MDQVRSVRRDSLGGGGGRGRDRVRLADGKENTDTLRERRVINLTAFKGEK